MGTYISCRCYDGNRWDFIIEQMSRTDVIQEIHLVIGRLMINEVSHVLTTQNMLCPTNN